MPPQEVESHWAYRLTWWVLHHGDLLLPVGLVLMALLFVVCTALVWAQAGARWIVVFWIWREFIRGLRSRRPPGGAGGHTGAHNGHSALYTRYMQSPQWAARSRRTIRLAGGLCERCGRAQATMAHHLHYDTLGFEGDGDLQAVCARCHPAADAERRAHGR